MTPFGQHTLRSVDIDLLEPLQAGPRPTFSADEVEMARLVGILEPVIAQPTADTRPPRYRILAGEASWYLAQAAHLHQVPVRVLEDLSESDVDLIQQARERATRTASPLDPARSARRRLEGSRRRTTIAEQAHQLGLSRTELNHRLRVLRLPSRVVQLVDRGQLTVGKARALVALRDPAAQERLAEEIVRNKLSTRQVEARIREATASPRANRPKTVLAPADTPQRAQPAAAKDPNVLRLEQRLGEHLGCPVDIAYGTDGRGTIRLDFFTLDDMENVLEHLGYAGD